LVQLSGLREICIFIKSLMKCLRILKSVNKIVKNRGVKEK